MTDYNSFFRNATLRICGSLEIEKALWQCLWYIQEVIPVSQMNIHLYDGATGIAETIAHATLEEYKSVSVKTRLQQKGRRQADVQRSSRIRNVLNTSDDPVAGPVCRQLGCLDLPTLVMDLVIEGKFLGVVSFHSFPGETFDKKHEELIAQLNEPFAIAVTNSIRYRELRKYKDVLEDDNQYLHNELRRIWGDEVIGSEFGLKRVMNLVRQVAPVDCSVLLMGETGVGKELIASTLHNLSSRRKGPFVDVNCGAIPESLMDSELFGHEKGAFTGAISRKRGRFERAQRGTIFLDEIGELSPEAQVRLLRVLQEKKIERVGGTEAINLDIRVIAATHRDLDRMMNEGRFRQDLFFRLKVFPIIIPPLRERKSDIPSLVHYFLQKKSLQMKVGFTPRLTTDATDRLMGYSWPGNVRELENAVERALILSRGEPLSFRETIFPDSNCLPGPEHGDPKIKSDIQTGAEESMNLDAAMTQHIQKALDMAKGKVEGKGGASQLLEINPRTLRHRMKRLGIPFGRKAKGKYDLSETKINQILSV